jgi:hypothetical protein
MSAATCKERATQPDSPRRSRPPGCAASSPFRRCSSITDRCGCAHSSRLGKTKNRQQRGMAGYFNRLLRLLTKTNQVLKHTAIIPADPDIANQHILITYFESGTNLLTAGSRIDSADVQIETIK